jgi:hypothetical protein
MVPNILELFFYRHKALSKNCLNNVQECVCEVFYIHNFHKKNGALSRMVFSFILE